MVGRRAGGCGHHGRLDCAGARYLAFRELNCHSSRLANFNLNTYVTPDVHAKLLRMHAEIQELEAEAR
jgi:hypothetical protein